MNGAIDALDVLRRIRFRSIRKSGVRRLPWRMQPAGSIIVQPTAYPCIVGLAGASSSTQRALLQQRWLASLLCVHSLTQSRHQRPPISACATYRGFTKRYDYALETLKDVRYDAWRTYDLNNTIRFHALRLHEVGIIKTAPEKIIAKGTDWRFLNELKRELKV